MKNSEQLLKTIVFWHKNICFGKESVLGANSKSSRQCLQQKLLKCFVKEYLNIGGIENEFFLVIHDQILNLCGNTCSNIEVFC